MIDIYRHVNNCDYNTALAELAEQIGLSSDRERPQGKTTLASKSQKTAKNVPELSQSRTEGQEATNVPPKGQNATQSRTDGQRGKVDYTEYYRACRRKLNDPRAIFSHP